MKNQHIPTVAFALRALAEACDDAELCAYARAARRLIRAQTTVELQAAHAALMAWCGDPLLSYDRFDEILHDAARAVRRALEVLAAPKATES